MTLTRGLGGKCAALSNTMTIQSGTRCENHCVALSARPSVLFIISDNISLASGHFGMLLRTTQRLGHLATAKMHVDHSDEDMKRQINDMCAEFNHLSTGWACVGRQRTRERWLTTAAIGDGGVFAGMYDCVE